MPLFVRVHPLSLRPVCDWLTEEIPTCAVNRRKHYIIHDQQVHVVHKNLYQVLFTLSHMKNVLNVWMWIKNTHVV